MTRIPVYRILTLILVTLPVFLSAQVPYFHVKTVEQLGENDRINCIEQCHDGFIYIGTSNGLFRFDGIEFMEIRIPAESRDITALNEDPHGDLLIGTKNGGLLIKKGDSAISHPAFASAENKNSVTSIIASSKDETWIATYGNGVFILNKDSLLHIDQNSGLPDLFFYTLISVPSGEVFGGSDAGLQIFNLEANNSFRIESLTSANGLPDNIVRSLALDSDGKVWIGTHSMGVAQFDTKTRTFYEPSISRPWQYGTISGILPQGNNIWLGTERRGIVNLGYKMEESIQSYYEQDGLANDRIYTMFEDKEGNIWVGGQGNQLIRTNKRFTFIDTHEEVSFRNILAITTDSKGNIWFSTKNGLYKHSIVFNGNNIMQRPLGNSVLNEQTIISLLEDNQGYIWAGTFDHGVIRIDPETGKTKLYDNSNGLTDNNVIAIGKKDHEVWLATLGGVARLVPVGDDYTITTYGKKDGLGNNYIFDIKEDRKGRIWFATDGSGLSMFENGKFTNFSKAMDSLSQVVYSITEDKNGEIWFSTPGNGVYHFNEKTFTPLRKANKEISRKSVSLATDQEGNIISISNNEIEIIDVNRHHIATYGSPYGVMSINPQLKAVATDILGNVWIGGEENTILLSGSTRAQTVRPQTRLLGVELLLQPIDLKAKGKLSYRENHLTFRFAGLWFQNPEAVQFRYMLVGYDMDWIYTLDRSATFSSLPPGSYTFKVQSSHTNNFDNSTEELVSFEIAEPFWSTTWFIILSVFIIAGALFLVTRERMNRLKKYENDQREKLAFQLETLRNQVSPHFLFNAFNTLLHLIEEDKKTSIRYVENMSHFFRDILQYRDRDLIPLEEELALSEHYLYLQSQRYQQNLTTEFDLDEKLKRFLIPPLTLQLLLENALKHNMATRTKPLHIRVNSKDGYLFISNNLQLKSTMGPSTKIGLENIRKRFALLTKDPVIIEQTDETFSVGVPLLKPGI